MVDKHRVQSGRASYTTSANGSSSSMFGKFRQQDISKDKYSLDFNAEDKLNVPKQRFTKGGERTMQVSHSGRSFNSRLEELQNDL